MSEGVTSEFSGWRSIIWPVHRYELPKLIPMLVILFLITFNYNILRTMKDTLVIATGKDSGAEVIPFIKVWVMFPGSILMTYVFTKLCNRLSREFVFYVMMSLFLGYFLFFIAFLYPCSDTLHLHGFAEYLKAYLPIGLNGFIAMVRNWCFTTFYVMSELWGNIILFLLFWGFANQITHLNEAKRFYALLGVATNGSGIIAGRIAVKISSFSFMNSIPYGSNAWDQQILLLVMIVIFSGLLSMGIFRWMHTHVLDSMTGETVADTKGDVKGKMSMRDNFSYLFKSRYLLCIAVITIAYNIVINLVEVPWKHQVRLLYPNPSDFNLYMNKVMMTIGIIATLTSLFMTGSFIRIFGWTRAAMLTPILLLITSVLFFGSFFLHGHFHDYAMIVLGISPLAVVVFFGTLQNCLSRGAKYTIYDATKEMAFVPLGQECKIKGKAAIDGVCNRLGKSGGSLIHQFLLFFLSTITASAPYIAGILLFIIFIWMGAVKFLGKEFTLLTNEEEGRGSLPVLQPNLQQEPILEGH